MARLIPLHKLECMAHRLGGEVEIDAAAGQAHYTAPSGRHYVANIHPAPREGDPA